MAELELFQEFEDSFVSDYLNRFDVLILIALKRIGLSYISRKMIITHYKKVNNERKREKEIQRFIFKTQTRPHHFPYQQGLNNLVPFFRKYGRYKFEKNYKQYLKKILNDLPPHLKSRINKDDINRWSGPLLGLQALWLLTEKYNDNEVGTFFDELNLQQNHDYLTCRVPRTGDILTNIDVNDPESLVESVHLKFDTRESIYFTKENSLFNLDLPMASLVFADIYICIKLKPEVDRYDSVKVFACYHQLGVNQRRVLANYKWSLEHSKVINFTTNYLIESGGVLRYKPTPPIETKKHCRTPPDNRSFWSRIFQGFF